MYKTKRTWGPGTIVLALVLAFFVGAMIGGRGAGIAPTFAGPEAPPEHVDLAPLWKAWRLLDEKHVSATTTGSNEDRVWGLISGLANSYDDPYTVFLPPRESRSFEEDIAGSFGGVGIEIGMRNGMLTIIAPLKGTPGEEAGLRSGDIILEVDEESTKKMAIDEVVSRIRGEVNTTVVLTIAREGEQEFLTIPVVRSVIEVPTLDSEMRPDGIFVISLYNFGGTAVREMGAALRTFIESGSDKLVIDLRGNPGGYLESAVDMASWFLPLRKAIVIEDFGTSREQVIRRAKGTDISKSSWRIVILIDGGSASASEILAGALQEHEKAILIGEQTYGKGSVQELVNVTPETSLKITVAQWLTPGGIALSETGLTPDLVVERTLADYEAERDPQMDAAVRYLLTGILEAPEPEAEEGEVLEEASEIE
jgi:carboxyl-terminal processing protease